MFADPISPPTAPQSAAPSLERTNSNSPTMINHIMQPPLKPAASAVSSSFDGVAAVVSPASSAGNSPASSPPATRASTSGIPAASAALKALATNTVAVGELQENLVMQDRIISALEADNQRLLQENKMLKVKLRESQQHAATKTMQQQQPSTSSSASSPQPSGRPAVAAATLEQLQEEQLAKLSPDQQLTVANLQQQLAQFKHEMEAERKDMVRKISWYVDRQEVSAAQDALITEQQQQIRDLRLHVADLEAQMMTATGVRTGAGGDSSQKDKQVRLQARRIAELEEALRNRHPDSLAELIRATRPPLTEAAEFRKMKAQLEEATQRLADSDESAQRAITQLRVESDALRAHYAKRLEKVGEEMKLRIAATQTRKTKELAKQLDDTRRFYSEKVKDLEAQLAGYRRGDHITERRAPSATTSGRTSSASRANNNNQNQNQNDQDHAQQHPQFASLSYPYPMPTTANQTGAGSAADSNRASSVSRSRSPPRRGNNSNNNNTNNNQQQQQQQQQPMSMMPYSMMMMNPFVQQMMAMNNNNNGAPVMIPVPDPGMQQRLWFLETRVKSLEEENRFLQKTASESVLSTGAAAAVQSQLGESHREVVALQRLLKESQEQQRRTVEELDERLHSERQSHSRELERLTANHRDELKALQTRCDAEIRLRTDSIASRQLMAFSSGLSNVMGQDLGANCSTKELRRYLLLLAERVHCLERQLAAAESEYSRQLAEVRRVAEFELEVEKQKMGVALKQKNAEIDSFRIQLDSMLEQIARLRKK